MGLFASIATACARAFSERSEFTWIPSSTGSRLMIAPQRAFVASARQTHMSGPREQTLPKPAECVQQRDPLRSHSAPCSHPVLKLRACCEHEAHATGTHRRVRMVISGRMSDVCAELERLVALENRVGTPARH